MDDHLKQNEGVPKFIRILIILLAFSSPLGIIQTSGYSIFFLMCLITIICLVVFRGTIKIDNLFFLFILLLFVTTIYAHINPINSAWTNRATKGFISMVLIAFVYFLMNGDTHKTELISAFRKGIGWIINVNIFWAVLQVIMYKLKTVDINTIIFVDNLHVAEIGSKFYKGTTLVASGLHWHPANLAPLLVLGLLLNEKVWYKAIIIAVTLLTFSSTAILGVGVCLFLEILFNSHSSLTTHNYRTITKKNLIGFFIGFLFLIVVLIILIKTGFTSQLADVTESVTAKFNLTSTDASANAHMDYYRYLPTILNNTPILKTIFGYGYGCSGYAYSMLLGQYTYLDTWAVESDVVNNVLGMGILNSFLLYTWIAFIGIKGAKLNYKYLIFIIVVIIQGVTYNIQFDWVILLMCILSTSIKNNVDFFSER